MVVFDEMLMLSMNYYVTVCFAQKSCSCINNNFDRINGFHLLWRLIFCLENEPRKVKM